MRSLTRIGLLFFLMSPTLFGQVFTLTEYRDQLGCCGPAPYGIVAGQDGALWFLDQTNGTTIGRITTSGVITEYRIPSGAYPNTITAGPDGALWFTEVFNKIGRISMSGVITEYYLPLGQSSGPTGIVTGPDGALWFTVWTTPGQIGRITTSGDVTMYPLPTDSGPMGIVAGSDGALWFVETSPAKIGRITTNGAITEYPLSPSLSVNWARKIIAGPDGALWVTIGENKSIGRIATNGVLIQYQLPTPDYFPISQIVVGPDGALWFVETVVDHSSYKMGRITTSGVITEYTLPPALYGYPDLAVGPDGAFWVTEIASSQDMWSKIGRLAFFTNSCAFPQVAVGGGYSTLFTVTNTGSTSASGNLILTNQQGNPLTVNGTLTDASGTTQPTLSGYSFPLTIPAGGTVFLSATGLTTGSSVTVGWGELDSTGGSLTAVATYEYTVGSTLKTMVGVLQSQALQYATLPVDNNTSQSKQTVYAIANPSSQTIAIKLALVGQDGTVVDDTVTVTLLPGQQIARYLWQDLARTNFKGSLVFRGQNGATFIAVALVEKQGVMAVIPLISGKAPGVPN